MSKISWKKRKNYYALFGEDGFGIYENWEDVVEQRRFLRKCNAKGFDTAEDAFEYAKDQYNKLQKEPGNIYQDRYLGVKMNKLHKNRTHEAGEEK